MTPQQFNRLLAAPELVVVDLLDSALSALRLALLAEHPLLDEPLTENDPPVQRRARAILRSARHLRCALRHYRRAVDQVLNQPDDPQLPF
jgi:ParB-like chromosome segregation protein Spo0J